MLTFLNPSAMKGIAERVGQNKDLSFAGKISAMAGELIGIRDTEGERTEPADLQEALRKRKGISTAPAAAAATVPATSAISLGTQGDALSRIGLFVGGRPEVGALRNIEANTRDTAQGMRQLLTAMRETRDAIQYHNE